MAGDGRVKCELGPLEGVFKGPEMLQVSLADLEDALSQNKLGTFMESLGISVDDAWELRNVGPRGLGGPRWQGNTRNMHGFVDRCNP